MVMSGMSRRSIFQSKRRSEMADTAGGVDVDAISLRFTKLKGEGTRAMLKDVNGRKDRKEGRKREDSESGPKIYFEKEGTRRCGWPRGQDGKGPAASALNRKHAA